MRIPEFLRSRLYRHFVQRVAQSRTADVFIGGPENPYLIRWYVISRNRFFNIYLHSIVRDDDDRALHDHPWINCSIILSGGYSERLPTIQAVPLEGEPPAYIPDYQKTVAVWRSPGSVLLRWPSAAHRLELMPRLLPDDSGYVQDPTWTLFITGPRWRVWGFHCPQGWKDWRDFTNFRRSGDSHTVGPGCGD